MKLVTMRRTALLGLALFAILVSGALLTAQPRDQERIFPTPADASKSPPEKLAYVVATYAGTDIKKPDYLATIDVDPAVADLFAGDPSCCTMPQRRR